jgi:hypothetical protein
MQTELEQEQRPDRKADHQPTQEQAPAEAAEKNQEQQLDEGTESPG